MRAPGPDAGAGRGEGAGAGAGSASASGAGVGAPGAWATWQGMRTVKREPMPGSLLQKISPPSSASRCLQMLRPSPVPPYAPLMLSSAWQNGSKMRLSCCWLMPMPWSLTLATRQALVPSGVAASRCRRTVTLPEEVNLMALLSRLPRICAMRVRSEHTRCGTLLPISLARCSFFRSACGRCRASTSSSSRRGSKSRSSMFIWPASTLDRSRMSFRMRIRCCTPSPIRCAYCCCDASSSVSCSSSAMPAIPAMGVRISWLMMARKRDLAAFAASARACSASAMAASRSWRRSRAMISAMARASTSTLMTAAPPMVRSMRRQAAR